MNQLAKETSPYLLQHAHNPVDWHAWNEASLAKAKKENKPILVSIGYSTCHWCHVMERESFEDPDVAEVMNTHFICIKVDREERPDIDAVYMEACQILTGGGGWPLNCFLTPDARPFYAGTYYPPRPAHNRPSWIQVLHHLGRAWREQPAEVLAQAEKLMGYMQRSDEPPVKGTANSLATDLEGTTNSRDRVGEAFLNLRDRFDTHEGGFGGAPKFPGAMSISFLLQFYYFSGHFDALEHALFSLEKMCMGGIYDHLGGGFARYATDNAWLIPHFEKMLYDNALLVGALSDAVKILQNKNDASDKDVERLQLFQNTIDETLGWVNREMTHPLGGFFSAQDADSEGVEGKFFVWELNEVGAILQKDGLSAMETDWFCQFYDITEEGNWEEKNIMHRPQPILAFAEKNKIPLNQLEAVLGKGRSALFAARSKRIYPGLDDKILLSWNALMVSAYTQAFTATGNENYRKQALWGMDFLIKGFFPEGTHAPAKHSWKDNTAQITAFLEDYAYLIAAILDIYQISFDEKWIALAVHLTETVNLEFYDATDGLYFFTSSEQTDIITRKKDLYDNATPAANSTMCRNLQRLSILADRSDWQLMAEKMIVAMTPSVVKFPNAFGRWAEALLNHAFPVREIAISGMGSAAMAINLQKYFLPNSIIAASEKLSDLPLLAGKWEADALLIYICRNFACQRPVKTIEEALASLHPKLE